MRKVYISYGMPFAGKTTLFKKVYDVCGNCEYYYDNSIRNSGTYLNALIKKIFVNGDRYLFGEFQKYSMYNRHKVYLEAQSLALVDEVIYNTHIYTEALYSMGELSEYHYGEITEIYERLCGDIASKDVVVNVYCCFDDICERAKMSRMSHEKYYTYDYLLALYNSSKEVLEYIKRKHEDVINLDTSKYSINECVEIVQMHINKR